MEDPTAYCDSPVGWIRITGNHLGIKAITFLDEKPEILANPPECLQPAVNQLHEYFAGNRRAFDLKIVSAGTEFQEKVWNELRKIPFGVTISYTELAGKLGWACLEALQDLSGRNRYLLLQKSAASVTPAFET